MFTDFVKKIPVPKKYTTPVKLVLLTGVSIVVTLFINYLLAEQVTPEQYGSWRLFITITSFSGLFHFGLTDGITIQWLFSERSGWHKFAKRDFLYLLAQQIIIYGIVIALLKGQLFPQIDTAVIAPVLIANQIVLQNISGLIQSFFNRAHKFYYSPLLTLFSQTIFCIGIIFYRAGYLSSIDLVLFSNIQIAATILPMLYLISKQTKNWPAMERQDFRLTNLFSVISKSIGLGLPILLTGLLFLGFQSVDKILISAYYPAHQFGYYAFAATLLNVILTIVVSISNFLMQKLAPIRNSIELYYNKAVVVILNLVCLLLISIIPLQALIIQFIPKYAESAVYIRYLSGFIGPYLLVQLIQFSIFKLLNKQRIFLSLSIIIFSVTSVLLFTLSINQMPLSWIAFASALMAYVWFVSGDWLLCSIKPEFKPKQFKRYTFIASTICLYLLISYY